MTDGSALPAEPAPSAPWIRNPALVDYFNRIIREKKAVGVTIDQLCKWGSVSYPQFKRWRGIGGPQSLPKPERLRKWCKGNGLDPTEPLSLLDQTPEPFQDAEGSGLDGLEPDEVQSAAEALLAAVRDDEIDAADRAEAAAQLRLLESLLRDRAARRRESRGN